MLPYERGRHPANNHLGFVAVTVIEVYLFSIDS